MKNLISGIANIEGTYKNIIINENNFNNSNVKEIIYSTEYNEVESLFGFEDLNILEIEDDSSVIHNARIFLRDNDFAEAIIFLDRGFLIVTDLTFFSAYTRINGKDTPYTTLVESDTYEDEIALNLIEDDIRLQ